MVAETFLDWLSPGPGARWLDAGCGSGALSTLIARRYQPAALTAVDRSAAFARATQDRVGNPLVATTGDILALPLASRTADAAVSGLVLNFTADPAQAIRELRRVTALGGVVAAYIWDYGGVMEFLSRFWAAAIELDPDARHLNQADRFADANEASLHRWLSSAGLSGIATRPIVIEMYFRDLDDYWQPFLGGQGPAPTYVQTLSETDRERLRRHLLDRLPAQVDGSIILQARAWAGRGYV